MMNRILIYLLPAAAVLMLYGPVIKGVGYLSDDFHLLLYSKDKGLFEAMEGQHFSLLLNALFSSSSSGGIEPAHFHLLALVFHLINCVLIYLTLQAYFQFNRLQSGASALLFAINPAGSEALIWCCSLPYIVIATINLMTLWLFFSFLKNKNTPYHYFLFSPLAAIFQAAALLVWDWGVLLFPLLVATACFYPSEMQNSKKFRFLILSGLTWAACLLVKKALGLSMGYRFNSMRLSAEILFSSPLAALFPLGSNSFYSSWIGMFSTGGIFAYCSFAAWKDRRARLFFAIFLLCQMPAVLFGHPQSRYLYFPAFALFSLLVLSLDLFPRAAGAARLRACSLILLAAGYFLAVHTRVTLWLEADKIANTVRQEIEEAGLKVDAPFIVLDIPYWHGKEGMIWRPHLWRSGREYFLDKGAVCLITHDHPDCGTDRDQKIWSLEEAYEAFPLHPIFRFEQQAGQDAYNLRQLR